jgi:dihydropyrimidinase
VRGAPSTVLSRGEVIVDNGAFVGAKGRGRFVKRQPARPFES